MIDFAANCSPASARECGRQALEMAGVRLSADELHVGRRRSLSGDDARSATPALFVYESGHSYHFYAGILLTPAQWLSYLGALLLLDPPDATPQIDIRWLGHSLRHDHLFTSLRWTNHTGRYLRTPGDPGSAIEP